MTVRWDAVGTATITCPTSFWRTKSTADSMVYPEARPSSTRTTCRFARSGNGRPLRNSFSRRWSTLRVCATCALISRADSRRSSTIRSCNSTSPCGPMAPNPASGLPGIWILRTTNTSRGSESSREMAQPTGTPPAGMARMMPPGSTIPLSRSASALPASSRPGNTRFLPFKPGSSMSSPMGGWVSVGEG